MKQPEKKTSNKLINLTNRQSRHDRDTQQNPRTNISFVLEKQKPTLESEFTLLLELTNKEKDDRTPLDVDFLMKYLSETELMNKFRMENMSEISLKSMMYMCASNLEILKLKRNETLFRIDEVGDNFFIILKGNIGILKPDIGTVHNILPSEYWDHLIYLLENNDIYLLSKSLTANSEICPIKDIHEMKKVTNCRYKYLFNEQKEFITDLTELQNFFEQNKIVYEDFEIKFEEVKNLYEKFKNYEDNNFKMEWFNYIVEKMKINSEELTTYHRFSNFVKEKEKMDFLLIKYTKFMTLNQGQYFGDYALDNYNKRRTATIIAEDDCLLAMISHDIYNDYIQSEKIKVKQKEISFLNDNFFFISIKNINFTKRYYPNFAPHEYNRGHVLYMEGEPADSLIFVKEGQIELTFNGSLIDLQNLIKLLLAKFYESQKNNYLHQNEKTDFSYFNEYINDDLMTKLRNKSNQYIKEISQKKKIHVCLISTRDICGLEEIFLGNLNHFCKATIYSERAKIYNIEVEKLKFIFENEKNCGVPYFKTATSKIISIIKRLYHVRKTMTSFYLNESKNNDVERDKMINLHNETVGYSDGLNGVKILNQIVNKRKKNLNEIKGKLIKKENFIKIQPIIPTYIVETNNNSLRSKRISALFQRFLQPSQIEEIKQDQTRDQKKEEIYKKLIKSFNLEKIIHDIEKTRRYDNFKYDDVVLNQIKNNIKEFESNSIVTNSKSGEKIYSQYSNRNHNSTFYMTASKLPKNNAENVEIILDENYNNSHNISDNNFNPNNSNNSNNENENYLYKSHNSTFSKMNNGTMTTNVNKNDPKLVSYLNLFDYEKNDGNYNKHKNSPNLTVTSNPFQIRRNLCMNSSMKNLRNIKNDEVLNKQKSLIYSPSTTSLPIIIKYKNKIEEKKNKNKILDEKYGDFVKMMNTFDYNLNKDKMKFSVKTVKDFHNENKSKGYSKILSKNNSFLKMKIKNSKNI